MLNIIKIIGIDIFRIIGKEKQEIELKDIIEYCK